MMNEVWREACQQKAWAMQALIAACAGCSGDELRQPAAGFGSILATLNHLVSADERYVASLDGNRAVWGVADSDTHDLPALAARVAESLLSWEQFLREPLDGERLAYLDNGAYETHAAIVLMQALHHASVHGEQVCKRLEALGLEPPDLQPWAYADETGRSRWLGPQD